MIALLIVGCVLGYFLLGTLVVGVFHRIEKALKPNESFDWIIDPDDPGFTGFMTLFWPFLLLIGIGAMAGRSVAGLVRIVSGDR